MSEWPVEALAWISLGGDDFNYRTVDADTGKALTVKLGSSAQVSGV